MQRPQGGELSSTQGLAAHQDPELRGGLDDLASGHRTYQGSVSRGRGLGTPMATGQGDELVEEAGRTALGQEVPGVEQRLVHVQRHGVLLRHSQGAGAERGADWLARALAWNKCFQVEDKEVKLFDSSWLHFSSLRILGAPNNITSRRWHKNNRWRLTTAEALKGPARLPEILEGA